MLRVTNQHLTFKISQQSSFFSKPMCLAFFISLLLHFCFFALFKFVDDSEINTNYSSPPLTVYAYFAPSAPNHFKAHSSIEPFHTPIPPSFAFFDVEKIELPDFTFLERCEHTPLILELDNDLR